MAIALERVLNRWGVRAPSSRSNKQFVGPICTLKFTLTDASADNMQDLRTADAWMQDPGAKSAYGLSSGGVNPDCYCLVTEVIVIGSSWAWVNADPDDKLAAAAQMQLKIGPSGVEDRYNLTGHIVDGACIDTAWGTTTATEKAFARLDGVAFALPDPQLLDLRTGSTFQIGYEDTAVNFGSDVNMQVKLRGGLIPRGSVDLPAGMSGLADICGANAMKPKFLQAQAQRAASAKRIIGSFLPFQRVPR